MATFQCTKCGLTKPIDQRSRRRYTDICKPCTNARQRSYRKADGNLLTRRYEKTKSGFLVRLYRNMTSRVTGVQRHKYRLYAGKSLLPRDEFYAWANESPAFHQLFRDWEASGYDRTLTPSVDRLDSSLGYEVGNIEWVTHSENSRRGTESKNAMKHS